MIEIKKKATSELDLLFSEAYISDILRRPIDNRTSQYKTNTILELAVSQMWVAWEVVPFNLLKGSAKYSTSA
jgi:hypothetical protein